MGFKAEDVIEPLAYDFGKYADLKGVIEEPSDKQIIIFQAGLRREIVRTLKEQNVPDPEKEASALSNEDFLKMLESVDDKAAEETLKRQAKIFADVCSGHPTMTQLLHVPIRARLKFFRWLTDELLNPEVSAGAGNAPVIPLRPVAGG